MKNMLIVLLVIFLSASCFASDKKDEDVKYEITISVTYNAVSIDKAKEIIADALKRHEDACKNSVSIRKASDNDLSVVSGNSLFFAPN